MPRSFEKSWLRSFAALAALLAFVACSDGEPTASGADDEEPEVGGLSAALLEDRRVTMIDEAGERVQVPALMDDQHDGIQLYMHLRNACSYGSAPFVPRNVSQSCLMSAAQAALNTCAASQYLRLAEAVQETRLISTTATPEGGGEEATVYLLIEGDAPPEQWPVLSVSDSLGNEVRMIPQQTSATRTARMPVPTASDAASLALAASFLARIGTLSGAEVTKLCQSSELQTGMTGPLTGTSLGEFVGATIVDASSTMMEAAEKASKLLHAAAQARHGTSDDAQSGRVFAWRGAYDSRLRAASAYVFVPKTLYEPGSLCEVFPDDSDCSPRPQGCLRGRGAGACSKVFPVVDALEERAQDRRAEELLREHEIDPRVAANRTLDVIANELLVSINGRLAGAYRNFMVGGAPSGVAYLRRIGIESADFARAAERITQSAAVLGKPMVARREDVYVDLDGSANTPPAKFTVTRASGMQKTLEPVNPWYLYATTETAAWPTDGTFEQSNVTGPGWQQRPTYAYGSKGALHALDYARYVLTNRLAVFPQRGQPGAEAFEEIRNTFENAIAYANSYVHGRLVVGVNPNVHGATSSLSAIDAADVRIFTANEERRPGETNGAAYDERRRTYAAEHYRIWYGEEGLECALHGHDAAGNSCAVREHSFEPAPFITVDGDLSMAMTPSVAPCQRGTSGDDCLRIAPFGTDQASISPRVYLTEHRCDPDAPNSCTTLLLAGFAIAHPGNTEGGDAGWRQFTVPFGPGIEQAMRATLAADPTEPDEAELVCGESGMPRNIKLGLESELLTSQSGAAENEVEESWAYYLRTAAKAAEEADKLGDELVARGIELDERSEKARAELEKLCGGTIDVGGLREAACGHDDPGKPCDVLHYIRETPVAEAPHLQKLKQCLGEFDAEPAGTGGNGNVMLGSYAVCAWRVKTGPGPNDRTRFGECGPLAQNRCPARAASRAELEDWAEINQQYTSQAFAPAYAPQPERVQFGLVNGTWAWPQDEWNERIRQNSDLCYRYFTPPTVIDTTPGKKTPENPFPPEVEFVAFADTVSVIPPILSAEPTPYACESSVSIRGGAEGEPISLIGSFDKDMLKKVAKRIEVERSDLNFVKLRLDGGDWLSVFADEDAQPWNAATGFPCAKHEALSEGFDCDDENRHGASLLCGMTCTGNTDEERIIAMQDAGERLAKAAELLRVISNAGLEKIEVALPAGLRHHAAVTVPGTPQVTLPAQYEWSTQAAGPFEHVSWELSPEDVKPIEAAVDGAWLKTADRQLLGVQRCDIQRLSRFGEDPDYNYCYDYDSDEEELSSLEHRAKYHGTWLNAKVQDQKIPVKVRQVCIGNPGNQPLTAYPFQTAMTYTTGEYFPATTSLHIPRAALRLPPACLSEFNGGRLMTFMDASHFVTWPRMDDVQVDAFWKTQLGPLLQAAVGSVLQYEEEVTRLSPISNLQVSVDADEFRHMTAPFLKQATLPGQYTTRDYYALANFSQQNLLDAFELACMATSAKFAKVDCNFLPDPTDVKGMDDLSRTQAVLQCRAKQIANHMNVMMLRGMPRPLIDSLRAQSLADISNNFGGDYAQAVIQLYNAIVAIGASYNSIQSNVRLMSSAYAAAAAQVQAIGYKRDADFEKATMDMELADHKCSYANLQIGIASSAAAAQSIDISNPYSLIGAGIAGADAALMAWIEAKHVCGAGDIQQRHLSAINSLVQKGSQAEITTVVQGLSSTLVNIYQSNEKALDGLKLGYAEAQGALLKLEDLRNQAQSAVANVFMMDSDSVGRQFNVNTAYRARLNTLRVRYENAQRYAIRMAYLARRSIEQKLGLHLDEMTDPVGWVEAPRKWVDTLCSLKGIDYGEIRSAKQQQSADGSSSGQTAHGQLDDGVYNYANQYVGAYVQRLEELMTAYENTYVSTTGRDTVVMSVRDELLNVRDMQCDVQGPNWLLHTATSRNSPLPGGSGSNAVVDAWKGTCDREGTCLKPAKSTESPFVCYTSTGRPAFSADENEDCPAWGPVSNIVESVQLTQVDYGVVLSGESPSTNPPPGAAYWYRADQCDPSSTPLCRDLTQQHHDTTAADGLITKSQSGIGGKPTLTIPTGARISVPAMTEMTSEFTFATVIRHENVGSAIFLWDLSTRASGEQAVTYAGTWEPSWMGIQQFADWREQDLAPRYTLWARGPIAPQVRPQAGDVLTIRGDGSGVQLYLNGQLRASTTMAAIPTSLGGFLPLGISAGTQFAEALAYPYALTDRELSNLHSYLVARYGIDARKPVYWLNADVIEDFRVGDGSSATSGYRFTDGLIHDAATGLVADDVPSPTMNRTLVEFSPGHMGLPLVGVDDYVGFGSAGRTFERREHGDSEAEVDPGAPEHMAATVIAKCDGTGRDHRLFTTHLRSGQNPYDGRLHLDVNGATGRIEFVDTQRGLTAGSGPGVIDCGGATPFVATIRTWEGRRTDIFVNGVRVHSTPDATPIGLTAHFGGRDGKYLRGVIAEGLVHIHPMSDRDLAQLHASLGAKYGIAVSSDPSSELEGGLEQSDVASYRQWVALDRGTYLLSWYERGMGPSGGLLPVIADERERTARFKRAQSGRLQAGQDRWLSPEWSRYWGTFEITEPGDYSIGWTLSTEAETDRVMFALPQLERVFSLQTTGPAPAFPTDDDWSLPVATCEDRDGSTFREKHWAYGCEYYCPPALGDQCASLAADPSALPKRCFYEVKFTLDQEAIESGQQAGAGGIAAGNFNYRFEDLAVNVVGTEVKDCTRADAPSTCYANNHVQYSLHHDGPFVVRNYFGENYDAPIYPARIQQAKALLAERYITNPISGADNGLLQRFWDRELLGRPLDGSYTLRIYDSKELDFSHLEDVQLILNYRYWTKPD